MAALNHTALRTASQDRKQTTAHLHWCEGQCAAEAAGGRKPTDKPTASHYSPPAHYINQ
jgi:hypothetical protein